MKIAYLHQYFVTPDQGGATRSYEFATRLAAAGHEVHMVTSDPNRERWGRGWDVRRLDGFYVHSTPVRYNNNMKYRERIFAFIAFAWRAARRIPGIGADIVFATSTPLTIAIPAIWAAWRGSVPMVFEIRDLWPDVPIAIGALRNPLAIRAAKWLERLAYRNAARVVALAPGMKDAVVGTGYPEDKVVVIPNGSDLKIFSVAPGIREELRARFRWLGQRKLLVYIGALGYVNGVDYLIRLAFECKHLDPEIRFAVLGTGKLESDLHRLASDLGVLNENLFMLGKVSKAEVARWLAASDMSIALIHGPKVLWENATQNKFFDSLAAGRPIANNTRGWQAQIAEAEGCGVILDSDDMKRASRQLLGVLSDDSWLDSAGKAAKALAHERFSRDDHARLLERVLVDALADRRRKATSRVA